MDKVADIPVDKLRSPKSEFTPKASDGKEIVPSE